MPLDDSSMNQSLRAALDRLLRPSDDARIDDVHVAALQPRTVALLTRASIALLAVAAFATAVRARGLRAELFAALAFLPLAHLASPISWKAHHAALLALFFAQLCATAELPRRKWLVALLAVYYVACDLASEELLGKEAKNWLQAISLVTWFDVVLLAVACGLAWRQRARERVHERLPGLTLPRRTERRDMARGLESTDDRDQDGFDRKKLDKSVIALPLLEDIQAPGGREAVHAVIIDLNLEYYEGRDQARERIKQLIGKLVPKGSKDERIHKKSEAIQRSQYVFADLRGSTILELVARDKQCDKKLKDVSAERQRAVYRIWPDFPVHALCNKSIATIKADAAHRAFLASGNGITWAVLDSGIDGEHPHFVEHGNLLDLREPLEHQCFTDVDGDDALHDGFGHGTHVAGIIAGRGKKGKLRAVVRQRDEHSTSEDAHHVDVSITEISGMAPECKLLSFKVLDDQGRGKSSNIITALQRIQELNNHGRLLKVHGINLSVGYGFDAEWFACGQSPMCIEVDRLVRSGVVVVVAAGNTGYGSLESEYRGTVKGPLALSINDPGNAQLAITVGATHRDMPHVYGVSYFSSKGPTGDGRAKPDLVAPGEKIISCAAGSKRERSTPAKRGKGPAKGTVWYREDSGTSMAAPHVSGAIAAFLSARNEFIGRTEEVKRLFLESATDLNRERYFQGHGLLDLMRAIQSV
jgi:subtilisin family serine protease